jgi:glutamine phosphoribosylpyrophosphate amidotransferase
MCGVIGVKITDVSNVDELLIRTLFQQTMIRGKHATGVTYVRDGKLHTIKEGIPADEFIEKHNIFDWVDTDNSIALIGHIRYSTSDLRYNQPFANDDLSIVHNGVISQEPVETWQFKTETANDSEMILRSWESGIHPFNSFPMSSMAVCALRKSKMLIGMRNHERPLWVSKIDKGIVFTSTKDIALRSGIGTPQKCEMFTEYMFDKTLIMRHHETPSVNDLQ